MRFAVIDSSGYVENIIEAEPDFDMPERELVGIEGHANAAVGSNWDGASFSAPLPEQSDAERVDEAFVASINSATTLDELKAALVGGEGPGAQPRRRPVDPSS